MLRNFCQNVAFFLLLYPLYLSANDKAIFAQYRDWGIYSPNYHINDIEIAKLTHLVYESALLNKDGSVVSGDLYADQQYFHPGFDLQNTHSDGSFGQLRQFKKSNDQLKTLISIGGWNRSQYYSEVVLDAELRSRFVHSALQFVQDNGFDGLVLNWSYKTITLVDGKWLQAEQDAYLKLITAFRDEINTLNLQLTKPILLNVTLEQQRTYLQGLAIDEIFKSADFVHLNSDYLNSSEGNKTRNISALYSDKADANFSINQAVLWIQKQTLLLNKLTLTIPSFSIGWYGVNSAEPDASLYESASLGSWDSYGSYSGLYARPHLLKIQENSAYKKHWDEQSQSSYLYNKTNLHGHFISFESRRSIAAKVNYVEKMQLAGISISQLHNDSKQHNSIIDMVFDELNPWLSLKLLAEGFYKNYRFKIQLFIAFLLISFFLLLLNYYRNRSIEHQDKQDRLNFIQLQAQLQSISVPLRSCLQLNQKAQKKGIFESNDNGALSISFKLMQQLDLLTQQLLQDTCLGQNQRAINRKSFLLHELVCEVVQILKAKQSHTAIKIITQLSEETMIVSDRNYLQQVLLYLLGVAVLRGKQQVVIELHLKMIDPWLEIQVVEFAPDKSYSQWQDLLCSRKIINKLQGELVIEDDGDRVSSSIKMINLVNIHDENAKEAELLDNEKQLAEPDYLRLIGDFANQVAMQNSVDHIVEHAYQLLCKTFTHLTVSVLQGNKTLYKPDGENGHQKEYIEIAQLLDYSFVIYDISQRNSDQVLFIKTLISQISMIREQLCQMVKTPRLLIELYEIASQKEKIEYIQAAKGYSGLYLKGMKEPTYVTLRLRGIKQYFNDNVLLQIHRSYLVNPNKVIAVMQVSRMSYVIQLETLQLPIGRSYLPLLRTNYPHWFQ